MPDKFSIVIICKNEADVIGDVLQSCINLSDDIVVYDSGSTDNTVKILKNFPVQLYHGEWFGFGKTKQHAAGLAKYDWILSIDADEALDETLQQHLKTTSFSSTSAYRIKRKNFLGKKYLKWGEWGNDYPIRLFNKKNVNWNDDPVHEQLALPPEIKIETLHGSLLHYTMKDTFEYSQKMIAYAMLNAQKYYKQQKKASWLKRYLAPPFSFFKHYFLQLGFLDGWEGILSARMTAFYTFLKYSLLHDLWQKEANI